MKKLELSEVTNISVDWLYEGDLFQYESKPGTLIYNKTNSSIRFTLREIDGWDYPFEVLIRGQKDRFSATIDYEDLDDKVHPLEVYKSSKGMLLVFKDSINKAYIHLLQEPA